MSNTNANNNTPNNSNNKTSFPAGNKKKKVIAVTSGIIIAMLVIIAIVGITWHSSSKYDNADDSMVNTGDFAEESTNEFDETTESTTETTTQDLIEESGAIEICSGSDAEGNEYKLVCTQEESYDKVTVKVGVIKNNQWLQKLSTKSPFLNEDGSNMLGLSSSPRNRRVFSDYHYVADGVFVVQYYDNNTYSYLFYNSNNKKSATIHIQRIEFTYDHPYSKYIVFSRWHSLIGGDITVYVLNTETMEEKVIIDETNSSLYGGYSEGLFMLKDGFYNLKGEKVIDMQKYNISGYYNYYGSEENDRYPEYEYFVDGGFKFCVENSAGTIYNMEIDKKGNLIKNEVSPYQKK